MHKNFLLFLVLFVLAAALIRCSEDEDSSSGTPKGNEDPSFASNIQPIFNSNCLGPGCHSSPGQAGLVLSQDAFDNIVNVHSTQVPALWRARPGRLDSSYVVFKIEGQQSVGSRMPMFSTPLKDAEVAVIQLWICSLDFLEKDSGAVKGEAVKKSPEIE